MKRRVEASTAFYLPAIALLLIVSHETVAFQPNRHRSKTSCSSVLRAAAKAKDNKAMQFLKKIGRAGHKKDFTHAIGVDEGTCGKTTGDGEHMVCTIR